jgi:hypothetical protein
LGALAGFVIATGAAVVNNELKRFLSLNGAGGAGR